MAVELKNGIELDFSTKKYGTGQRGTWCLFNVKAEQGSNRITVWASNAEEASQYTTGRIKSIESVRYGNKKGNDGKWYPDVSVHATIEGVDADKMNKASAYDKFMANAGDFMDIPAGSPEDGLPFT